MTDMQVKYQTMKANRAWQQAQEAEMQRSRYQARELEEAKQAETRRHNKADERLQQSRNYLEALRQVSSNSQNIYKNIVDRMDRMDDKAMGTLKMFM